ncbi:MAG: hypothetical protein KF752_05380 [Pirellulaceae bacterium]|nr:hypothetical protein [Pirellulaceae bacterium]
MKMFRPLLILGAALGGVLSLSVSVRAQEEAIAEAVPQTGAAASAASNSGVSSVVRPITVTASLTDDATAITGTLSDTNTLSIKTAFGLAELPLSEVAGVRFPRAEDTSTTVVMLNGDSITGATDVKFITIETVWGSAKINGQSIASMLFVPGLAWQSVDVLGSQRWQLVERPRVTPVQPGANIPGQPNPAQGPSRVPVQPAPGARASN